MPIPNLARSACLAIAFGLAVNAAHASDVDPMAEAPTAAAEPGRSFFRTWFTPKPARPGDAETIAVAERTVALVDLTSLATMPAHRAGELVAEALGLIGINYRRGGESPESGFDCSGLVRYAFQQSIGLMLPRRAEEISRVGTKVDRSDLKPGDLVFYNTLRRTFSHVGIYLGNNRFIHAPSSGGAVRVDDMSQTYWASRFDGARRVGG